MLTSVFRLFIILTGIALAATGGLYFLYRTTVTANNSMTFVNEAMDSVQGAYDLLEKESSLLRSVKISAAVSGGLLIAAVAVGIIRMLLDRRKANEKE